MLCIVAINVVGQTTSSLRWKKINATNDTLIIDSLTIFTQSMKVFCGKQLLPETAYFFDGISRKFVLKSTQYTDTLQLRYRVFAMNFQKSFQSVDTSIIYKEIGKKENYLYRENETQMDFFSDVGINKSGSISRGISFGNAQDLAVNSSLNLQLDGKITNNMRILASLTDKNLPIQPEGNTSRLQDFDQVFVQLYGEKYKIIGGDFWLKKPQGYFLNYNKKVQGLYGQYNWGKENHNWLARAGGALSKGKFARNVIQGMEGNQGPYRMQGNENEPFIVVLSGTESVYLNGELLERGEKLDYVINYNTAELTFTPRHLITKDARIVVEFQYTDQNYARSLFAGDIHYQGNQFEFWLNYYTEQDAKNQTLQQDLSDKDKFLLSDIGDSLSLARIQSIDSLGFMDNQVMYKMIDSLGIDSILVHSVAQDSAVYRVTFTTVGSGKGNYVFDRFTANGRVFKWVAPIGGIPQGNYEPYRIMVTPKKKAMITAGMAYKFNKHWKIKSELSTSNNDLNTFSNRDDKDNRGFANKTSIIGYFSLGRDSLTPWGLETQLNVEYASAQFLPIERYRSVEFGRDWNVNNRAYSGFQLLGSLTGKVIHENYGFIQLDGQNYTLGQNYQGNRAKLLVNWHQKGFSADVKASYLKSHSIDRNTYIRHITKLSQEIGPVKIGFADNHERNTFNQGDSLLRPNSYQWYEWEAFIMQSDSMKNQFKAFYKERYDWKSDSVRLMRAATARSIGISFEWITNKHSNLSTMVSYRKLTIQDNELLNQDPENTFLGRVDYQLNIWKRALTMGVFYQIGSGLERKKEFLYVKVNAGQGVYTWIDYNKDGIKDLNEFEQAQFPDQANYIRVFTPTDNYVRTYSNDFNQTLFWRPERIWGTKKGFLHFLSRISNQTRFRIEKKLSHPSGRVYNPFINAIEDTNLMRFNSLIRNTVYFNRTNPIYGAHYTYEESGTKMILANGFDSRALEKHTLSLRWNIFKKITIKVALEDGSKQSIVDYTSGRDYTIDFRSIKPVFIYQPNTRFRLALSSRYEEKYNAKMIGGEAAYIGDFGLEMRWNQLQKGSVMVQVNYVNIHYSGDPFLPVAYEMLNSLKPGNNFTWSLQFQRNISEHLQLNIHYNGRKSQGHKTIHSGGVEVRAFF